MLGKIIKGIAGFYYVYAEDEEVYACRAKGIFRKDNQKPLVGDNVEITVLHEKDKEGSLTDILPRKNSLIRPAVANVDQAFVLFALEDPKPNFLLLDRFLIMMEQAGIPAVICFNKKDLAQEEETEKLQRLRIPGDPFQHCKRRRDPGDTKSAPGKDNGGGRSFGCGKILPDQYPAAGSKNGNRGDQPETEKRPSYHPSFSGGPHRKGHVSYGYAWFFFFISYGYGRAGIKRLFPGISSI